MRLSLKVHLRVLVDERQGVRHVAVAEVHDREPHPASALALHAPEDPVHLPGDLRALLHAVEPLAGVLQPIETTEARTVSGWPRRWQLACAFL